MNVESKTWVVDVDHPAVWHHIRDSATRGADPRLCASCRAQDAREIEPLYTAEQDRSRLATRPPKRGDLDTRSRSASPSVKMRKLRQLERDLGADDDVDHPAVGHHVRNRTQLLMVMIVRVQGSKNGG